MGATADTGYRAVIERTTDNWQTDLPLVTSFLCILKERGEGMNKNLKLDLDRREFVIKIKFS